MKKLKMKKDYWFPSPKYIDHRKRKRSIAKIFDIEYEDELDKYNLSGISHWSSTTAQPRMKFVIPIGDVKDKPSIAKRIKDLIKKFK